MVVTLSLNSQLELHLVKTKWNRKIWIEIDRERFAFSVWRNNYRYNKAYLYFRYQYFTFKFVTSIKTVLIDNGHRCTQTDYCF